MCGTSDNVMKWLSKTNRTFFKTDIFFERYMDHLFNSFEGPLYQEFNGYANIKLYYLYKGTMKLKLYMIIWGKKISRE